MYMYNMYVYTCNLMMLVYIQAISLLLCVYVCAGVSAVARGDSESVLREERATIGTGREKKGGEGGGKEKENQTVAILKKQLQEKTQRVHQLETIALESSEFSLTLSFSGLVLIQPLLWSGDFWFSLAITMDWYHCGLVLVPLPWSSNWCVNYHRDPGQQPGGAAQGEGCWDWKVQEVPQQSQEDHWGFWWGQVSCCRGQPWGEDKFIPITKSLRCYFKILLIRWACLPQTCACAFIHKWHTLKYRIAYNHALSSTRAASDAHVLRNDSTGEKLHGLTEIRVNLR